MKKVRKMYSPPSMRVFELKQTPCLLAGSEENGGGKLPDNPNVPI